VCWGWQHEDLGDAAVFFVRCSFRDTAMAAKYLVADNSGDRHAVEHVVDQLVKQATVNGAKRQRALMMEAAGAVLIHPPAGA
jgi:hypothetical protein